MVLVTIAGVLIFVLFTPGKTVLQLRNSDTNEIYSQYEAYEGMTFSVSFVHSVNKSRVLEGYIIKEGQIYLDSCTYSGFGAGVATEVEEGQTLSYNDDGEMVITGFNRKMNNLSYIVGTVSDHIFNINDEEISLRDLCGRNSTVRFEVLEKKYW
ncbi:MAG: DUF1850 domain-containing protein [Anaerotignaceae bacterium]